VDANIGAFLPNFRASDESISRKQETVGCIMGRRKRKLTPAQKAEKRRRREEYMTIFVNGKQKRVKRPLTVEGMDIDGFIRQNADPIWLHVNGLWECMADEE